MALHKSIRNQRIQNDFTDGKITIVEKKQKTDEYNTPIPGGPELKVLGSYFFRIVGIHSADKFEYGNKGIELEREVRIPLNFHITSGMTAYLNNDDSQLYDIIKVFPDMNQDETEILLAKEGGYYDAQE